MSEVDAFDMDDVLDRRDRVRKVLRMFFIFWIIQNNPPFSRFIFLSIY